MTTKVITAGPDEPTRDVARRLLDNQISAVPVVNGDGVPIGMVSDGDLIGRDENQRLARHDWWLDVMTGTQTSDDDFQARVRVPGRTARDVMSAPLVTVTENTSVSAIARLLSIHHVKRVPVVRDGCIVGIVSRADLLRVVAADKHHGAASPNKTHPGFLISMFGEYHRPAWQIVPVVTPAEGQPKPKVATLEADNFRQLVADFHSDENQHRDDTRRAAADQRRERAKELTDVHVFDEVWHDLVAHARTMAEHGQKEDMLLRFPNQLCLDGGRAINVHEEGWTATLRGEAAEICLRWERDLKQHGFTLSARVLEFPEGKPGDIGLFLVWER
ncbi:MAG: CBS domain-containing protein [Acetobacteraceae bacterium]|jgi:CBS domain-containing protein